MIFTCHTRRFVAATCRGDVSQRFVASCVSALRGFKRENKEGIRNGEKGHNDVFRDEMCVMAPHMLSQKNYNFDPMQLSIVFSPLRIPSLFSRLTDTP